MLARLVSASASLVTVMALTGAAQATETVVESRVSAAVATTSQHPVPAAIDESALRYYASLKQTTRVEAETRRLKRIDPQWQPPADLWSTRPGSANESSLWELFAAGKFDDLHRAIDARRARDPKWAPSTDLAQKVLRKDMQAKVLAGKLAGRWPDVAAAADQGRLADDTSAVEILWDISEAYARTNRPADALRVLTSILTNRSDPKERTATIQKAIALLAMADVERLIAMGRRDASGGNEFSDIGIDITRARVAAFLHGEPANDVSPADMTQFMDYARAVNDANQPGLVAWSNLKRGDLHEALEWFKIAIAKGGDATIAHGLAHTLKKLGQLREAEEVAYAWQEPSTANTIFFIDILASQLTRETPVPIDPKRLDRYAAVTMRTASGEGAQALGWYAYNSCQFDIAAEWFRRALAWFPKDTTAFGYALSLRRLKRNQEFLDVVNRYDGLFPKVLTLLFPEKLQQPGPCNAPEAMKKDQVADKQSEYLDLRTPQGDARSIGTNKSSPVTVVTRAKFEIPKPLTVPETAEIAPLVKRSEFPVAVDPENPLRFAPAGRGASPPSTPGVWRNRDLIVSVTAARRVPGVGPMPYERFGFTLLKSWSGNDKPSFLPLDTQAPTGTAWFVEQRETMAATMSRNNPAKAENTAARDTGGLPDAVLASRFHP